MMDGKLSSSRFLSFALNMMLLFQTWKKHTFCGVVVLVDSLIILPMSIIFRVEIFRATIDTQLAELTLKFNEKVMDLLSLSVTLIPKKWLCFFPSNRDMQSG